MVVPSQHKPSGNLFCRVRTPNDRTILSSRVGERANRMAAKYSASSSTCCHDWNFAKVVPDCRADEIVGGLDTRPNSVDGYVLNDGKLSWGNSLPLTVVSNIGRQNHDELFLEGFHVRFPLKSQWSRAITKRRLRCRLWRSV